MRKFIGTLAILILLVGGIGYSRGWFDFTKSDEPGSTNIELKIDREKIKEDAEMVKEKAKELTNRDSPSSSDAPVQESEDAADEGNQF